MVDDESLRRNMNATPQFIGALTELVWTQIGRSFHYLTACWFSANPGALENVAIDLETFSQHAGRTTVTTDDVLLLARRNSDLQSVIKDCVDKLKAAKAKEKTRAGKKK